MSESNNMRVPRPAVLAAVGLLGSVLLACSGAGNATSGGDTGSQDAASAASLAPAAGDVCSLLMPSEIATATGLNWVDGAVDPALSAADRFVCNWYNAGGEYAMVQVMMVANPAAFEAARVGAADVFGLAQGGISIAGAGNAYATEEGSLIGMLINGVFVQVTYIPPGPGEVLDATRQLAQAVAKRL